MPAYLTDNEVLRLRKRRAILVRRRRLVALGLLLVVLAIALTSVALAHNGSSGAKVQGGSPREHSLAYANVGLESAGGNTHPVFAKLRSKSLLLPVPLASVTIVAYSPLDDELAITLTPIGRRVDANLAARGALIDGESIPYYVLDKKSRTASETTSVDIGAAPGTAVVSPIAGTVVRVSQYRLFGKYDDVRIDIRPQGLSDVILSVLLIEEPQVKIGESVVGGKTVLGFVRNPVPELAKRIAALTGEEGAHVHLHATESPNSVD